MDRHDCYELCVQGVRWVVPFLRAVHAEEARVLREDFCGTAALSRRWIADLRKAGLDGSAAAVDLDPEVLARARNAAPNEPNLHLIQADAIHAPVAKHDACDIIFVGNFSIGYIHDRASLVAYLSRSAERLRMAQAGFGNGVFVCDLYDSPTKFTLGAIQRTHPARGPETVKYTWEHREADALTALVTNAIHFRVVVDGDVVSEMTDAFIYRWRLWSIPELRDAMHDAGFKHTDIYAQVGEHPIPLAHGQDLPESGIVCIAARV